MSDDAGEKKIIIDEDWKSQVEAEKEQLQNQPESPEGDDALGREMPPATFGMLLSTLATEAMVCLGQIPHPATGQPAANLPTAKYFIDTLGILQEKTKGNLEPEEDAALTDLLHQLRLAFVAVQSGVQPSAEPPSGPSPFEV